MKTPSIIATCLSLSLCNIALLTSTVAQANLGLNSIKSKGMGSTGIAHGYGKVSVVSNPANGIIFGLNEKVIAYSIGVREFSSEDIETNPHSDTYDSDLGDLIEGGISVATSSSYTSSSFGFGATFLSSDNLIRFQNPENAQEQLWINPAVDVYNLSYGYTTDSDWNVALGVNFLGLGLHAPEWDDGINSNEFKIDEYPWLLGIKMSKDFTLDMNNQSILLHTGFAATANGLSEFLGDGNIAAVTLAPSALIVGTYIELSHFNATLPYQLGLSAEYEVVHKYGEHNSMIDLELESRSRLGAELSFLSTGDNTEDDFWNVFLRAGISQHQLKTGDTSTDTSLGLGLQYGEWTFDTAWQRQAYPIDATIITAGLTFQY